MTAHLVALGVLSSVHGAESMIDVLLLGTTHQACRVWVGARAAIHPRWMKEKLPGLAWRTARAPKG